MTHTATLPAYANWTLDTVATLTRSSTAYALPQPCISLMGGNRVSTYVLEDDEYLIVVTQEGSVKRYGVLDADAFDTLRERVRPINENDHAYPSAIAAALDELARIVVEEGEEPSYDMDADDWDWSEADKELGIGSYVGGSRI